MSHAAAAVCTGPYPLRGRECRSVWRLRLRFTGEGGGVSSSEGPGRRKRWRRELAAAFY